MFNLEAKFQQMFIAIYRFEIKEEKKDQFIQGWKGLTDLIYQYEGSLGSRLHKKSPTVYIAYAQWPDEKTFTNSGAKMPEEADRFRSMMKEACTQITTEHTMEVVEDLLRAQKH